MNHHPRCSGGRSESFSQSKKQTPASSTRRKISRSRRLRQQGRIQKSPEDLKQQNDRLYVRVGILVLLLGKKKKKKNNHKKSELYCLLCVQRDTLGREEQDTFDPSNNDVIIPPPGVEVVVPQKTARLVQDEDSEEEGDMSQEEMILARKSAILMEIMESGASVEQTIEKYSDEIDHVMISLVEKRIQAARQLEQQEDVVEGLIALYRYLKAEHDRNTASPALRLLDTLLQIMSEEVETQSESYSDVSRATRQKVMARMQMAFDASLPLESDPLSLAHHLAQGKTRIIDDMLNETVKPLEFIHEVEVLLGHAMEQHALLEKQVEGMESSEAIQQALRARTAAIDNVQEIIIMARDISQRFRIQ